MFQKIVETNSLSDLFIHTLENGTLCAGFEVDLFDEEVFGLESAEQMLQSLLRDLPQGRTLRVYLKSEYSISEENVHSRSEAIKSIGFVRNRAFVFLEKPAKIDLVSFFKRNSLQSQNLLTDFNLIKDKIHYISIY